MFQALLAYKVDKKKIYLTCAKLGEKFPDFVSSLTDRILNYKEEEPNWKNLIYKAKVILISSMEKDRWPLTLPSYFSKHYLYIRDIEYYAFPNYRSAENEIW